MPVPSPALHPCAHQVDDNGRATGEYNTYTFCGKIRAMGEADEALNKCLQEDGFATKLYEGC